jgi:hypothetical protein
VPPKSCAFPPKRHVVTTTVRVSPGLREPLKLTGSITDSTRSDLHAAREEAEFLPTFQGSNANAESSGSLCFADEIIL